MARNSSPLGERLAPTAPASGEFSAMNSPLSRLSSPQLENQPLPSPSPLRGAACSLHPSPPPSPPSPLSPPSSSLPRLSPPSPCSLASSSLPRSSAHVVSVSQQGAEGAPSCFRTSRMKDSRQPSAEVGRSDAETLGDNVGGPARERTEIGLPQPEPLAVSCSPTSSAAALADGDEDGRQVLCSQKASNREKPFSGLLGRVSQWTASLGNPPSLPETEKETTESNDAETVAAQARATVSAAARAASSLGRWFSQAATGLVEELHTELDVSEDLKDFCGTISEGSHRWIEEHQAVLSHFTPSSSSFPPSSSSSSSSSLCTSFEDSRTSPKTEALPPEATAPSTATNGVHSRFSSLLSSTTLLVATAGDTAVNAVRSLAGQTPAAARAKEHEAQQAREEQSEEQGKGQSEGQLGERKEQEIIDQRERQKMCEEGRETGVLLTPFCERGGTAREQDVSPSENERMLPPIVARCSAEVQRRYEALVRSPSTFLADPTGRLVSRSVSPSSLCSGRLAHSVSDSNPVHGQAPSPPPWPRLHAFATAATAEEKTKRETASSLQECHLSPCHREEEDTSALDFSAFHVDAYDDLLDFFRDSQVMEMRRQLVPDRVEEGLFWRRLLFRVRLLCDEASLAESASSSAKVPERKLDARETFSELPENLERASATRELWQAVDVQPGRSQDPVAAYGNPRETDLRELIAQLDEEDIAWDDEEAEAAAANAEAEKGSPVSSLGSSLECLRSPPMSAQGDSAACLQTNSEHGAQLAGVSFSSLPSPVDSPALLSLSETPRASPSLNTPTVPGPLSPASPSSFSRSFPCFSSSKAALQPCTDSGPTASDSVYASALAAEKAVERDDLQVDASRSGEARFSASSSAAAPGGRTPDRLAATETRAALEDGFHVLELERGFGGCFTEAGERRNDAKESGDEQDVAVGEGEDDAGLVIL
ncbi:hypothetical protein TGP89_314390 [Toxoplasma gondii p89]|uniref:BSD domain-containing protein n=1 Tax=Toxoplasma gondii p89 TaxID=943119 RepID=A0A086KZN6_TOXGO|nr:hypothetical protein TGP89_314390 [Toxoplasma gondii p89]